jgi:hypothetical protein
MHKTNDILSASLANARVMIQENMRDNDQWLYRGLLAIFDRQTAEEQNTESTREDNGVGFSGVDGQILTSFAKQVERWNADRNPRFNSPLSPRQVTICRRKMSKYGMQLARIARANHARAEEARIQAEKLVEVESDMGYRN